MKIVVIGGSGLIGSKLIPILREQGHEAFSASPRSGVNAVTGEGLHEALTGADVVVDVSNSPSFADDDVMSFFNASTKHLIAAELELGVRHHVALSIVGAQRNLDSGYMRAKVAQEKLIESGGVPYGILNATQFFEFLEGIANAGMEDGRSILSTALFQPVAADDVAQLLAEVAVAQPINDKIELAGPEKLPMDQIIRNSLTALGDLREVIGAADAKYFGTTLSDDSLVPNGEYRTGKRSLKTWMEQGILRA